MYDAYLLGVLLELVGKVARVRERMVHTLLVALSTMNKKIMRVIMII